MLEKKALLILRYKDIAIVYVFLVTFFKKHARSQRISSIVSSVFPVETRESIHICGRIFVRTVRV